MLHVGTIREICKQLNENGYHISEYTLRLWWVKNAVIPAVFTGSRALISYDAVRRVLLCETESVS